MNTPIRLSATGDIECFSLDGKQCSSGFANDHECRIFINQNIQKYSTITCGNDMKSKTGHTGYDTASHWCQQGQQFFFHKWHCPYDTQLDVIVKFNAKSFQPECLSLNGNSCLKGPLVNKICNKVNHCDKFKSKVKPIPCAQTAFKDAGFNWCKKAFAFFRYTSEFSCIRNGADTPVRIDQDGFIECLSKDGKTCVLNQSTKQQCFNTVLNMSRKNKVKTISCGNHLKQLTGLTGFEDANQWCSRSVKPLFSKISSDKYETNKLVKAQMQFYLAKQKHATKWVARLQKLLKSPQSKTNQGLLAIKQLLVKHKVKNLQKLWNKIVAYVKLNKHKFLINYVRRHARSVKKHYLTAMPHWWIKVLKVFKTHFGRTPKGIEHIKKILHKHGLKITKKTWNYVVSTIKNGTIASNKVFFKVAQILRSRIAKLKRRVKVRMPKWWRKLIQLVKKARSNTDISKIKAILDKHRFRVKSKVWNTIVNKIRSGQMRDVKVFKRIVRKIQSHVPALRGLLLKKRRDTRRWLKKLIKYLKSSSKVKANERLAHIRAVLTKHKFKFNATNWKYIANNINKLNAKVLKRIVKTIKRFTPKSKSKSHGRHHKRRLPKWLKKLIRFIRHIKLSAPKAELAAKFNHIKAVLQKHNFKLTPKQWNNVVKSIKNKTFNVKKHFKSVLNKLSPKNSPLNIVLSVNEKYCKIKFLETLRKLLKKKDAKTETGLTRIRNYLTSHFKLSEEQWSKIKQAIINNRLSTRSGKTSVIGKVNEAIPKGHFKEPDSQKK